MSQFSFRYATKPSVDASVKFVRDKRVKLKKTAMKIPAGPDAQFEIIKFLYKFKGDNKFYKLDENTINIESKQDKYVSIYRLRDSAFIATDTEVYYHDGAENEPSHFTKADEIKAKILPKGIVAVESMLEKGGPA